MKNYSNYSEVSMAPSHELLIIYRGKICFRVWFDVEKETGRWHRTRSGSPARECLHAAAAVLRVKLAGTELWPSQGVAVLAGQPGRERESSRSEDIWCIDFSLISPHLLRTTRLQFVFSSRHRVSSHEPPAGHTLEVVFWLHSLCLDTARKAKAKKQAG